MSEKMYVSDCDGPLQAEIEGSFAWLEKGGKQVACLVGSEDIETIEELINACGYTVESVIKKRVKIIIEEKARHE